MKKQNTQSLDVAKGLALLSQLAISIVTPLLLFVFGAKYLIERYGWGSYWIAIAIVLGVLVGLSSAYSMVQGMLLEQRRRAKQEQDPSVQAISDARARIEARGSDKRQSEDETR